MEGYDFIFEHHKIADSDFVPNTIEDFHATKKVRQSIFFSQVGMLRNDS